MHFVRRQTVLAAAALALFTAPAAAQTLPPAQQVIDRYVEAVGGRDRVRSVQSRRMVYEMNAGSVVSRMSVAKRRPNFALVAVQTPMGEIGYGINGDVVWAEGMLGPERLEEAQAEDIRIHNAFDADILFDIYPTMETVERAEYGGKPCWKVRMETSTGSVMLRCFDVETGLMVATIQSRGGVEVPVVFDEYMEVDGLKYPAHSIANASGQIVETRLVSVSHADIPESEFAIPDGVQ